MRYCLIAALCVALFSSPAHAACTSPAGQESQTRYDFTAHKMLYCDGTDWVEMGGGDDTLAALGCAEGESVGMGTSAWECIAPGAGGGNPDFYVTTSAYNGALAGAACAAGYHMCTGTEFYGRALNKALGVAVTMQDSWIDGISFSSCDGWTSASGSDYGATLGLFDGQPTIQYATASIRCNTARAVMCCQD